MKNAALLLIVLITSVISAEFISIENKPVEASIVTNAEPFKKEKKESEALYIKEDKWKDPVINSFSLAEKLITVIKNQNNILPYKYLDEDYLLLSIGSNNETFLQTLKLFIDVKHSIVSD